jgi:hypothetical protein
MLTVGAMMKQYLDTLLADAGVIEVRHIAKHGRFTRSTSGRFDNTDDLIQAIQPWMHYGNLYTTLNRPADTSVSNTMDKDVKAFSDADICRVVRLPFDFDPERGNEPSTRDELAMAAERAKGAFEFLYQQGWGIPLKAASGNGYHMQYRCALPADTETSQMLDVIYNGMHRRFSDDVVTFDRTVRNPARVFRLYGTRNRKGDYTPDRPFRMSKAFHPQDYPQVTRKQIALLAEMFAREMPVAEPVLTVRGESRGTIPVGRGDFSSLDVVSWMQSHGLYLRQINDNTHAITCPWSHEHSTSGSYNDCIVHPAGGRSWPSFHCHHAHCADRKIGDVISLLGDADAFCSKEYEYAHAV